MVGTFLPIIVAKLNATEWSATTKGFVAFISCVVAAGVTAYFNGSFTGADYVTAFLTVFVAATVTYKTYWSPSGIADKLERK